MSQPVPTAVKQCSIPPKKRPAPSPSQADCSSSKAPKLVAPPRPVPAPPKYPPSRQQVAKSHYYGLLGKWFAQHPQLVSKQAGTPAAPATPGVDPDEDPYEEEARELAADEKRRQDAVKAEESGEDCHAAAVDAPEDDHAAAVEAAVEAPEVEDLQIHVLSATAAKTSGDLSIAVRVRVFDGADAYEMTLQQTQHGEPGEV